MTEPKSDLAYLRNEKAKAEQKLRACQHREKILERQMSELNRRERVHRLCTRAGMLESFLVCPGELTNDQVMELLMRSPGVIFSTDKIMESVWGWDSESEVSVVWVHISNLRKKLKAIGSAAAIRVIRGMGTAAMLLRSAFSSSPASL